MFKFVIYRTNKCDWTSQKFETWEAANEHFEIQMKVLGGTGGDIKQNIGGKIGWVLCNENPED